MAAAVYGHRGIVEQLLVHPEIQANFLSNNGWTALMLAARYGREGIAKLLLACPDPMVNLTNNDGWSALMLAAFHGHIGVVELLLSRSETFLDAVDNEGWSALRLATHSGQEGVVALLLAVPHIDATARSATDGHTAMSLAVAKGHTGIVRLLEEFESRQARPSTQDPTLHPGHPTAEDSIGEETRSGSSGDYQGGEEWWAREDVMGVKRADNLFTQDEPSGSRRDTKRPRGDGDNGLQHSVDDIAAPTPKRQRVAVVVEGP
ncbi:ankyrin repeat-containing domain protein [Coprinopsis sp. MPI-PUGE-AT-0042]|nr:ankyrin repeat-containing domain protein [Coprinopsis sp. MPI-PUGE-AT-0042]